MTNSKSVDPLNVLECFVKIQNTSQEKLNGLYGLAVNFSEERYLVRLASTDGTDNLKRLKPENITKTTQMESMKAQYEFITTDKQAKEQMSGYYLSCYNSIQSLFFGLKPENILAVVCIMFMISWYFMGFIKSFMLGSLFSYSSYVLLPLIRDRRLTFDNIKSRNYSLITKTMPFLGQYLTPTTALIPAAIFIVYVVATIFFRGVRRGGIQNLPIDINKKDIYELGFNDCQKS